MEQAVEAYGEYVCNQVLADSISFKDNDGKTAEFDEFNLNISLQKK